MAKVLPQWCKQAKTELINRDMTINMLAEAIGKTREFTSGVINGRIYSKPAVKEICDYLNIPEKAGEQIDFKLSDWCKQVKCELTVRDMKISDLANEVGMSKNYTSAIVNGRVYSEPAIRTISEFLNISQTACSLNCN